jgi:hypothetical protein
MVALTSVPRAATSGARAFLNLSPRPGLTGEVEPKASYGSFGVRGSNPQSSEAWLGLGHQVW